MLDAAAARFAAASVATLATLIVLRHAAWLCLRPRRTAPVESTPVESTPVGGTPGEGTLVEAGPSGHPAGLLAGAGLAAALFVGLAVLAVDGTLRGFDAFVAQSVAPLRGAASIVLLQLVTDMGSTGATTIVGLVAGVLLWTAGRAGDLRPLGLALLGAMATTWGAKYALALPRPEFVTSTVAVSPTFPSAHAAGAIALYGTLAVLVVRRLQRPRARFEVGFWALVLIGGIGFSRVFLGVHNASDVAAGCLVGSVWLLLALALARRRL